LRKNILQHLQAQIFKICILIAAFHIQHKKVRMSVFFNVSYYPTKWMAIFSETQTCFIT
jgi:hypothetical protein